jgi:hypothetical protein
LSQPGDPRSESALHLPAIPSPGPAEPSLPALLPARAPGEERCLRYCVDPAVCPKPTPGTTRHDHAIRCPPRRWPGGAGDRLPACPSVGSPKPRSSQLSPTRSLGPGGAGRRVIGQRVGAPTRTARSGQLPPNRWLGPDPNAQVDGRVGQQRRHVPIRLAAPTPAPKGPGPPGFPLDGPTEKWAQPTDLPARPAARCPAGAGGAARSRRDHLNRGRQPRRTGRGSCRRHATVRRRRSRPGQRRPVVGPGRRPRAAGQFHARAAGGIDDAHGTSDHRRTARPCLGPDECTAKAVGVGVRSAGYR